MERKRERLERQAEIEALQHRIGERKYRNPRTHKLGSYEKPSKKDIIDALDEEQEKKTLNRHTKRLIKSSLDHIPFEPRRSYDKQMKEFNTKGYEIVGDVELLKKQHARAIGREVFAKSRKDLAQTIEKRVLNAHAKKLGQEVFADVRAKTLGQKVFDTKRRNDEAVAKRLGEQVFQKQRVDQLASKLSQEATNMNAIKLGQEVFGKQYKKEVEKEARHILAMEEGKRAFSKLPRKNVKKTVLRKSSPKRYQRVHNPVKKHVIRKTKVVRKVGVRKTKSPSDWIEYVKQYRSRHPGISYKQALIGASKERKGMKGPKKLHTLKSRKVGIHKVHQTTKKSGGNPWILFVNAYRKKHPKLSYKQVLIEASKHYVSRV